VKHVVQPHGAEFRFLYMRLVMNAEFGGDFRATGVVTKQNDLKIQDAATSSWSARYAESPRYVRGRVRGGENGQHSCSVFSIPAVALSATIDFSQR
jgi:hypothetical protein